MKIGHTLVLSLCSTHDLQCLLPTVFQIFKYSLWFKEEPQLIQRYPLSDTVRCATIDELQCSYIVGLNNGRVLHIDNRACVFPKEILQCSSACTALACASSLSESLRNTVVVGTANDGLGLVYFSGDDSDTNATLHCADGISIHDEVSSIVVGISGFALIQLHSGKLLLHSLYQNHVSGVIKEESAEHGAAWENLLLGNVEFAFVTVAFVEHNASDESAETKVLSIEISPKTHEEAWPDLRLTRPESPMLQRMLDQDSKETQSDLSGRACRNQSKATDSKPVTRTGTAPQTATAPQTRAETNVQSVNDETTSTDFVSRTVQLLCGSQSTKKLRRRVQELEKEVFQASR